MGGGGVDQVAGDYGLHHQLGEEHDHHRPLPVEEVVAMALDCSFIVKMRLIISYGLYFILIIPDHLQLCFRQCLIYSLALVFTGHLVFVTRKLPDRWFPLF